MILPRRIRTIYVKELVDILRDRRTLIAMIVVPILLYPLLMIGSIQAVSVQAEKLREEKAVLITVSESQSQLLQGWILQDASVITALAEIEIEARPADAAEAEEEPEPETLELFDVRHFTDDDSIEAVRQRMEELVQSRHVSAGAIIETANRGDRLTEQYTVELVYDPEEYRSSATAGRLIDLVQRRAQLQRLGRLDHLRIDPVVIKPYVIERTQVTTPGSILGQILPLVLVLMTITGAIYPAIDLTAGERERGTLETLMVCPVPVVDLVVGKFLVVTTVAIMGAALNLISVSATVYFGGFEAVVSAAGDEGFPLATLPLILLSLIPFAVLMSAIMIAVCSFARTFKEAQNYVTPVIMAVLIPGGIAAFPTARLDGVMQVMPVSNMVLLTRELLLGAEVSGGTALLVLLSTSLYAAAAVAIASRVFGAESVVFSDSASLKTTFNRALIRPSARPTVAMAGLVVAILFPIWFYVQSGLQGSGDIGGTLRRTGVLMPIFFVLVPLAICAYFKVNLGGTFVLPRPPARHLAAGLLLGLSGWVLVHELIVVQSHVLPIPEAMLQQDQLLQEALGGMSPWLALALLALIPAISEELLFRGFLLSGLGTTARKWTAIIVSACVFGVFHYFIIRLPVTALLGLVLGYLCWQARSIWPAMLMHALHNGITVSPVLWPRLLPGLGVAEDAGPMTHYPVHLLVPGVILFAAGLVLAAGRRAPSPEGR